MKMKKFIVLAAIAAGLVIGFNACKKDESVPGPSITVRDTQDKAEVNEINSLPVIIHVNVDPSTKLSKLSYIFKYKDAAGTEQTTKEKELKTVDNPATKDLIHRFKEVLAATEGTLVLMAVDGNGTQGKKEIAVKMSGENPPTPPAPEKTDFNSEVKKGTLGNIHGNYAGSFDLKNGKRLSASTTTKDTEKGSRYMINNTKYDQTFSAGWTSDAIDVGPASKRISGFSGNGAMYAKVTVNFNEVKVEDAKLAFDGASPSKEIKGLSEGDIVVGVLNSEIYLIKITKIDNSATRANTGAMDFDYKVGTLK